MLHLLINKWFSRRLGRDVKRRTPTSSTCVLEFAALTPTRLNILLLESHAVRVIGHSRRPVGKDAANADVLGQHMQCLHRRALVLERRPIDGLVVPAAVAVGQ